jgi:hypothetical protein
MSAADASAILARLEGAGLTVCVDGGWGVDALARRQTRPHDDLDLVARLEEIPALERELAALGYERVGGAPPMSFESVDAEGRQVDVHPIAADGAYRMRDGGVWHYPLRGLAGKGAIGGRAVRCLTAEAQVLCHAGYELDEDDLHDLRLLRPAPDVLEAFGASGDPEWLGSLAWRAGGLVVKPAGAVHAWLCSVLGALDDEGFRIERPRPDVVDGWSAWTYLEGTHERGRWPEIVATGDRLHAALADAPAPPRRDDAWSTGDRVAWGEQPYPALAGLLDALEPVDAAPQPVHGDLTGNVLFHDGLPPAVLDVSPYFRPPQFASAVVVADALCWEDAPPELARLVQRPFLQRALVYRAVTSMEVGGDGARELEVLRRLVA